MIRAWATIGACVAAAALGGCGWYHQMQAEAAIDHWVSAKMAMEREDYERALAELRKAIASDPSLSLAHTTMGDLYRKQGDYLHAAGAYEQACGLNPYDFTPHYRLGATYQALADAAGGVQLAAEYLRKATQAYIRAVTIRSRDFEANLNLSACYFQLGKYELAEQYCRSAIRADSANPWGPANLGTIYDVQGKHYDAVSAYKQSLELDVHQPMLLMNLGSTYVKLGRLHDALNVYEIAAREDAASSLPWEQIGSVHFHLGEYAKAQEAYEKALSLDERSASAHRGLGVVFMTQFVIDSARTELRDKGLARWHRSLELNSSQSDLLRLVEKYTPRAAVPQL